MTNPIQLLIYSSETGEHDITVILKDETIWATQNNMANLFGVDRSNISHHISNIYSEGELSRESTCEKISQVQSEGNRQVRRDLDYYNLDMIISIGYRVNSRKATDFRIWATNILKEYIIKGFAMDDERLKRNSSLFDKDYFDELLERVRSIRASERRIWQKITDIFAECSIDYDKDSPITRDFYAMVQNKFHYAITGKTAPEIIHDKADHYSENMGLTTWKNAPEGSIRKADVVVAKNYLTEKQIKQLERTVTGYFDYIENLLERGNPFTMEEFSSSVDKFLQFNEYEILIGKGNVSRDTAIKKAVDEYMIYNRTQKYLSDFDKSLRSNTYDGGDIK
ncbi:MAG: virulence RhuM family protein [Candidatus Methanomethylophilaceae archaeon]|nr:virulence RhuM family protein [Candidatus Methanomethylophilaceae archaeon]